MWLLGDVFNILGAVLQGVLPTRVRSLQRPYGYRSLTHANLGTQIILAIYYTIADIVLLAQCFYYRGFTWHDAAPSPPPKPVNAVGEADERTGLLQTHGANYRHEDHHEVDWSAGFSPAVPHISEAPPRVATVLQTILWNFLIVIMVIAAGVLGWFLGRKASGSDDGGSEKGSDTLHFSFWGQFFGYLCTVAYIASRLPQLILNYRRKTTEGLSMLFFLFACLGNITYVLSIFAYEPKCSGDVCEPGEAGRIYGRYILVNLSWLAGSLVTLVLDLCVFAQYFIYSKGEESETESYQTFPEDDDNQSIDSAEYDPRPLLQRGDSNYP